MTYFANTILVLQLPAMPDHLLYQCSDDNIIPEPVVVDHLKPSLVSPFYVYFYDVYRPRDVTRQYDHFQKLNLPLFHMPLRSKLFLTIFYWNKAAAPNLASSPQI